MKPAPLMIRIVLARVKFNPQKYRGLRAGNFA
jgi:hypothetical protein